MTRIAVLDHGYVELVGSMGGDLDIVNGARQSFDEASFLHHALCGLVTDSGGPCVCEDPGAGSDFMGYLTKKDRGLLNFLMRERHTSPYELVTAKFGVYVPIFVAREWMRHRTQSFNELSGRYTEIPEQFYVPHRDQVREQKGKPGAYYYERIKSDNTAELVRETIEQQAKDCFVSYNAMLRGGIAKEIARLVLPVNTYTRFVVSANLLNWMRFLSLRNEDHAQYEIRVYAEAIEELLKQVAPVAMEKFVKHGRLR